MTPMTDLNKRIKALSEQKGLEFKPWEFPRPWEVGDNEPDPGPPGCAGSLWWPKLMALRAALKKELNERDR
jgi:hypothetical protein